MSLENIKNQIFTLEDHHFNELFSTERVRLFGRKEDYKRHLEFSQKIFPYIHLIEILLRNKIDCALKKAIKTHQSLFTSEEWLFDLIDNQSITHPRSEDIKVKIINEMCKILNLANNPANPPIPSNIRDIVLSKTEKERKEIHSILISKLNLGTWRNIIAIAHEIDKRFFGAQTDLKQDIFPELYRHFASNNNDFESFFDPVCHKNIAQISDISRRIVIFVSCFTSLRNRMFHWEYLFKYDDRNRHSRIMTETKIPTIHKSKKLTFSLVANEQNIKKYLERLLRALSN